MYIYIYICIYKIIAEMNKSPSTPSDKVMYDMESKWKGI